jgi:hypothetical protein
MTKFPAMQFYIGDWLKDPELRMCCPATRGVWIDWLCAMHELDRCGQVVGSVVQLARLGHCTTDEVASTLAEIERTKTAVVTRDSHGIVTVTNRRMRRAYEDRVNACHRKRKERGQDSLTENSQESHSQPGEAVTALSRTPSSSSASAKAQGEEREREVELPPGFPETAEAGAVHAAFIGCPVAFAEEAWTKAASRGGRDAKDVQIRSFRHWLQTEWSYQRARDRVAKEKANGAPAGAGGQPTVFTLKTVLTAKEQEANALKNRHAAEGPLGSQWDNEDARQKFTKLRKEIRELNSKIAGMA